MNSMKIGLLLLAGFATGFVSVIAVVIVRSVLVMHPHMVQRVVEKIAGRY